MSLDIEKRRQDLRKKALKTLSLCKTPKKTREKRIHENLNELFDRGILGKNLAGFQALNSEPDLRSFFKTKNLSFPVCDKDRLKFYKNKEEKWVKSDLGFKEPRDKKNPTDLKNLSSILIPGVVFDRLGNRLGRGKGFYDRTLEKVDPKTLLVGVAFKDQVLEEALPSLPHDQTLDVLVTEDFVLLFSKNKKTKKTLRSPA